MTFLININDMSAESHGKTAIESVYEALRQAILVGEIAPESRLRVEELRKKFGVGASTVREALSRLLAENLVTTEGQRGFHAAKVSLGEFHQITSTRILLETQAVRESIANGDDAWENRLVAAAHQLSKVEAVMADSRYDENYILQWEERNNEFHNALVSACGNQWLLRFREMVFTHAFRYRRLSVKERNVPRDVSAEHQAIFKAAIARDAEEAARVTAIHIQKSIDVLEAGVASLEQPD